MVRRFKTTIKQYYRRSVRDRALLIIGWTGALRRCELTDLDIEDISFLNDGIILEIKHSKTDQKKKGQQIAIPFGSNPLTCPVRTMKIWIDESNITSGARNVNIYIYS